MCVCVSVCGAGFVDQINAVCLHIFNCGESVLFAEQSRWNETWTWTATSVIKIKHSISNVTEQNCRKWTTETDNSYDYDYIVHCAYGLDHLEALNVEAKRMESNQTNAYVVVTYPSTVNGNRGLIWCDFATSVVLWCTWSSRARTWWLIYIHTRNCELEQRELFAELF